VAHRPKFPPRVGQHVATYGQHTSMIIVGDPAVCGMQHRIVPHLASRRRPVLFPLWMHRVRGVFCVSTVFCVLCFVFCVLCVTQGWCVYGRVGMGGYGCSHYFFILPSWARFLVAWHFALLKLGVKYRHATLSCILVQSTHTLQCTSAPTPKHHINTNTNIRSGPVS
jgi:hypothetical protein